MARLIPQDELASRPFIVTAVLTEGGGSADLLSMASVLHRRGVDVIEAALTRPSNGRRQFHATFLADPRMASTVCATFKNKVGVLEAVLFDALDLRDTRVDPPVMAAAG